MSRQCALLLLLGVVCAAQAPATSGDVGPMQVPPGGIRCDKICETQGYVPKPWAEWSPDGQRILFGHRDQKTGATAVRVARRDGAETADVANILSDNAGWVDSRRIWYLGYHLIEDRWQPGNLLWIVDPETRKKRFIPVSPDPRSPLVFSPRTEEFVYIEGGMLVSRSIRPGRPKHQLLDTRFTRANLPEIALAYGNSTLVVSIPRDGKCELKAIDLTGPTRAARIIADSAFGPAQVSANGRKVLYVKQGSKPMSLGAEIHLYDLETDTDDVLLGAGGECGDQMIHAALSPDGKRVAYLCLSHFVGLRSIGRLFILDLQSRNTVEVPRPLDPELDGEIGYVAGGDWSADSRFFAVHTIAASSGDDTEKPPIPDDALTPGVPGPVIPEQPRRSDRIYNGGLFAVMADGTKLTHIGSGLATWSPVSTTLVTDFGGTLSVLSIR